MKTFTLLALAAASGFANAHSTVFSIYVNDVNQGLANTANAYIRSPANNDPVKDVTSTDMTCNVANVASPTTVKVVGGDTITFEWHHNDATSSDDIIASSHLGPVMVYVAPTSSNGAGDVWIKLAEDGYDGAWAVDRLIANKGKHSIVLPDLAAGKYLLRPEIIALHEGFTVGGAQFYMECIQIEVTSAGAKTLPAGVAIPGTYAATDAGVNFDLYNGFTSYPIPGPAVWDGASGTVATSASSVASAVSTAVASSVVSAVPTTSTKAPVVTSVVSVAVPTTLVTAVKSSSSKVATSVKATATPTAVSGAVAEYWQCGGVNYTGSTTCASGLICKQWNPYYYQCIKSS